MHKIYNCKWANERVQRARANVLHERRPDLINKGVSQKNKIKQQTVTFEISNNVHEAKHAGL